MKNPQLFVILKSHQDVVKIFIETKVAAMNLEDAALGINIAYFKRNDLN